MKRIPTEISQLGSCPHDSPLKSLLTEAGGRDHFVRDGESIYFDIKADPRAQRECQGASLESAGPREKIFFDPARVKAAVVTCGGLCPGISDVIRSIVMTLSYRYGVGEVLGIRYGYQGMSEQSGHPPVTLTPEKVADIHKDGGSILGISRGAQEKEGIADFLQNRGVNMLFVIGGDGTQRGALELAGALEKRNLPISVIGIPKTVDNDILHIDRTFGFATAAATASSVIETAHAEAMAQRGGIGLVKLMGRHSGFIACFSALACNDVNFVLIPEVPFDLEGESGFLEALRRRLDKRGHAVVLVAEGAGQELIAGDAPGTDASGNVRFKDIGLFLKDRIQRYFAASKTEINLKYIDPSYIIRAVPAIPVDSLYCARLGQNAVHAAMAGKTKMVVGIRHNRYVHLPMALIGEGRKRVNPHGDLWLSVLESTGQPVSMKAAEVSKAKP